MGKIDTDAKKNRIEYLDMTKGICILLVILGHQLEVDHPLRNVIYSFHMALFLILSGVLECETKGYDRPFRVFLGKKVEGLFTPYLIWSVIYMLADLLRAILSLGPANRLVFDFVQMCSGYGINVLWFLSILLISHIIIYVLFHRFGNREKAFFIIICMAVVSALLWNWFKELFGGGTLSALQRMVLWCVTSVLRPLLLTPFVYIGYFGAKMLEREKAYSLFIGLPATSILFLAVNCFVSIRFRIETSFVSLEFTSLPFTYISGITGTVFIVFLCRWICSHISMDRIKWLLWCGRKSLLFMLVHEYLSIRDMMEASFVFINNAVLRFAAVYLACVLLVSGIVLLIDKPHRMLVLKVYDACFKKRIEKNRE